MQLQKPFHVGVDLEIITEVEYGRKMHDQNQPFA